jgi:hypothetical protein
MPIRLIGNLAAIEIKIEQIAHLVASHSWIGLTMGVMAGNASHIKYYWRHLQMVEM